MTTSDKKNASSNNPKPVFLEQEEALKRFKFDEYDFISDLDYDVCVLFDGDVSLNGDVDDESIDALFFNGIKREAQNELFIINGDLKIKGDFYVYEEHPCFLILGDIHCDVLHSFENFIHVTGDAYIKYVFNGNYNHGAITIEGVTKVPYLLNSDHQLDLNLSESTIAINYYSDYDDFLEYDYYSSGLPKALMKKAMKVEGDELFLDYDAFIDIVKSGKSPIKKSAKSLKIAIAEEVAALIRKAADNNGGTVKKLDLSDKKLTSIPAQVFELMSLKELRLGENNLDVIPPEINKLKNLKVLDLESSQASCINHVCQLENLEELNLRLCRYLKALPNDIGKLKNLKKLNLSHFEGEVTDEITQLSQLEELDIEGRYAHVNELVEFPTWACSLTNLKVLRMGTNSLLDFPQDILKLQNLETLTMTDSLGFVKDMPDLSQFKKLKHLECSGLSPNRRRLPVQHAILQNFFNIKTLETLCIRSYSSKERFLSNDDVDEIRERHKDNPEKLKAFEERLLGKSSNGQGYDYQERRAITLDDFNGLEKLTSLKALDIQWNDLDQLPAEISLLPQLETLKIYGNNFATSYITAFNEQKPSVNVITIKSF